jgi:molecular chaperone GrpE (heat shock protein)
MADNTENIEDEDETPKDDENTGEDEQQEDVEPERKEQESDEESDLRRQVDSLTTDLQACRSTIEELVKTVQAMQDKAADDTLGGADIEDSEELGGDDGDDDPDGVNLTLQDIMTRKDD